MSKKLLKCVHNHTEKEIQFYGCEIIKSSMPNPNKQKSNKCEKCGHYNTCKNHCQSEYLYTCGCPQTISPQEEDSMRNNNFYKLSCGKLHHVISANNNIYIDELCIDNKMKGEMTSCVLNSKMLTHKECEKIYQDENMKSQEEENKEKREKYIDLHTQEISNTFTPPIASEVKEECKDLNCKEHYGEEHFFHPENWDKILMEIISDCWRKDDEVGLFKGLKDLLSQAITTERNRIVAMIDEIDTTKFLTMEFTGGYRTALSDIKDLLTQIKK